MGKVFNNGIATGTGLSISSPTPADDRWAVDTYSDLASLPYKYTSLRTKVIDEDNWYEYYENTDTWVLSGSYTPEIQAIIIRSNTNDSITDSRLIGVQLENLLCIRGNSQCITLFDEWATEMDSITGTLTMVGFITPGTFILEFENQ